jgi:hypothetical protein
VPNPKPWTKDDFDSIWIVTPSGDSASMATDQEQITPSATCRF